MLARVTLGLYLLLLGWTGLFGAFLPAWVLSLLAVIAGLLTLASR